VTWRDPNYTGPQFRKIFVVGLSAQDLTDQRGFEDLMVSTLRSAGIAAVPGYQFVPAGRTPDSDTMRTAVLQSGADAVLLTRITGFTAESQVTPIGGPLMPYGPDMYGGWYQPAVVVDYQKATVYTTLFDVRTARQVWTFNAKTYNPATVRQDAPRYAAEVVSLLRTTNLLAAP
jgi:hypothetical protein